MSSERKITADHWPFSGQNGLANQTMKLSIYNYIDIQGVWLASLAHSLLVHAFHLYILHGRLLLVLLYSMSKLNNNGSKARYSNRPSLIINLVI